MNIKGMFARTSWALIDQSLVSVANFALSVLAVRLLGIDEFGIYSLTVLAIFFANGVQSAFISNPMAIISQKMEKEMCNVYYCTVFGQQIALSFVLISLVFLAYFFSNTLSILISVKQLVFPFIGMLFASQLQEFLRRYFFGLNRFVEIFCLDLLKYLTQFTLLYWFSIQTTVMSCEEYLWALCWGSLFSVVIFIKQFQFVGVNAVLLIDS